MSHSRHLFCSFQANFLQSNVNINLGKKLTAQVQRENRIQNELEKCKRTLKTLASTYHSIHSIVNLKSLQSKDEISSESVALTSSSSETLESENAIFQWMLFPRKKWLRIEIGEKTFLANCCILHLDRHQSRASGKID